MLNGLTLVDLQQDTLENAKTTYNHRTLFNLREYIKKVTTPNKKSFLQLGESIALNVPELYVSIKDLHPIDVYSNQFYDNAFAQKLTVFLQHIAGSSNQQIANILVTSNTSNTKHPRMPNRARHDLHRDMPGQQEFFSAEELTQVDEEEEEEETEEPTPKRGRRNDTTEKEQTEKEEPTAKRERRNETIVIKSLDGPDEVRLHMDNDGYVDLIPEEHEPASTLYDKHGTRDRFFPVRSPRREREERANVNPASMDPYDVKISLYEIPTFTHFAVKIEGLHDTTYLQTNVVAAIQKSVSMLNARAPSRLRGDIFGNVPRHADMFNLGDVIDKGMAEVSKAHTDPKLLDTFRDLAAIFRFFLMRYVLRLTNIQNLPAFKPVTFWLYDFEERDLVIVAINVIGLEHKLQGQEETGANGALKHFTHEEQEVIIGLTHIIAHILLKGTESYIQLYQRRCTELEHPVFKDETLTQRFADLVAVQCSIAKVANPSGSYVPVGELQRLQRHQSYILHFFENNT